MKTRWQGWRGILFLLLVSGAAAGAVVVAPEVVATPVSNSRLTAADYVELHRTRSESPPALRPRPQKSALPRAAGSS
jgi:hypothetical protein